MKWLILTVTTLMLSACTPAAPRNTGVYLLLDTSGTYSEELQKAQGIILYTLSRLQPTDSFAVARIDTGSFSEKDIIAKATFDDRPSTANGQKRAFADQIKVFVKHVERREPHRHHRRGAAGHRVSQREGLGPQDRPDLLGPAGGPRERLHPRRADGPEGLRSRRAQRHQAAHRQLRSARISRRVSTRGASESKRAAAAGG